MQGFGKNTASPSGEDDFSTNPKGLALLGRAEHELPLPVVMGTRLLKIYFSQSYPIRLKSFIMSFKIEMLSL